MLTAVVRTVIIYLTVSLAVRIMGKRTIGEMHPTDLVVSIMISDLATLPISDQEKPLTSGIVPMFTLVALELFFAYLILKIPLVRKLFVGESCKVVKNGKMIENAMRKIKVGIEDIEEQIRIAGYSDITSVGEVVVETNGQVSVIPKSECGLMPHLVIADGKIRKKDLENASMTKKDIASLLNKKGIRSEKEVLYMSVAKDEIIHLQKKEKYMKQRGKEG